MVAHFRGCSASPPPAPLVSPGDSEHCDIVLREMRKRFPERTIFAVGVSLGGNALTKRCGEQGGRCHRGGSIGIEPARPWHLGGRLFCTPTTGVQHLLCGRWVSYAKRMEQHPHLREKGFLAKPKSFPQFDEHYTAPTHGYSSAWDYYHRASSRGFIPNIRLPFLLLNAMNDPFVPASLFPKRMGSTDNVVLEQPTDGGHVGFVTGHSLGVWTGCRNGSANSSCRIP